MRSKDLTQEAVTNHRHVGKRKEERQGGNINRKGDVVLTVDKSKSILRRTNIKGCGGTCL